MISDISKVTNIVVSEIARTQADHETRAMTPSRPVPRNKLRGTVFDIAWLDELPSPHVGKRGSKGVKDGR